MRAGAHWMEADQPSQAVAFYSHAAHLRPDNIGTHINLAAAQWRAGLFHEAHQTYERILATHPGHALASHGRGLAINRLGDLAGALAAFRAAVVSDPYAWSSWTSIADLTSDEEERRLAIDRTAEALRHQCLKTNALPSHFVQCATALCEAHRYSEAAAWIKAHFARFPDATIADECLARACYRLGAFKEAFHYQQRALRGLSPDTLPASPPSHPFAPAAAIVALGEVTDRLEAAGIEPFLAAGTLLGFIRHGGPLPHDRDVDIGVMRTSGTTPDIFGILRGHPGVWVRREHRPRDRYIAMTYKGVSIDLFLYDVTETAVCGFSERPGDIQWRFTLFGLTQIHRYGRRWRIPDAPERYLAETYGPHWRRPEVGFASVVSSPALDAVDPYVRAYYAAARAQQALVAGNEVKALALISQSPIYIVDLGQMPRKVNRSPRP